MNFKKSYGSYTLKSKASTRNASLACSGSLFPKLSSNWGGFGNLKNATVCCSFSSWVMPSKLLWIKHTRWGTQNSHEGFGSENPRSWSIAWGHLSNAAKRLDSCQDWRVTRAFKSRLIIPSELTHTEPMGHSHAGVCTSSFTASTLQPVHTCKTDSSKAALQTVCRVWTSLQNSLFAGLL